MDLSAPAELHTPRPITLTAIGVLAWLGLGICLFVGGYALWTAISFRMSMPTWEDPVDAALRADVANVLAAVLLALVVPFWRAIGLRRWACAVAVLAAGVAAVREEYFAIEAIQYLWRAPFLGLRSKLVIGSIDELMAFPMVVCALILAVAVVRSWRSLRPGF